MLNEDSDTNQTRQVQLEEPRPSGPPQAAQRSGGSEMRPSWENAWLSEELR